MAAGADEEMPFDHQRPKVLTTTDAGCPLCSHNWYLQLERFLSFESLSEKTVHHS